MIAAIVLLSVCAMLFALVLYSLWYDWKLSRGDTKWMRRDPTPDILLVSDEQARELECWPVLDKSNQG